MQSHLEELAGGVRLLAERPDVDSNRIFVLSNSEGCIHALNYQTTATTLPFVGLVLTAAFARPTGTLARTQIAAQLAGVPGGEEMLASYDAAMADFAADRPVNVDSSLPEALRNVILGVTPRAINLSLASYGLRIRCRCWLRQRPVLIVIGKKDVQVDWQADGGLFASLAQHRDNITLVHPENATHVLKYEPRAKSELTPAAVLASYAEDTVLDAETVETITFWLKGHATRGKAR